MKNHNFIRKSFVKMPLTLIVGAVVVICGFVYASHASGIHRTFQTATSHQPENFTELYFTDYKSLPHLLKVGKTYTVPFTITNHESKIFTYTYQTTLTRDGKNIVSKPVTVTVNNGKSIQQLAHINAKKSGDHLELVIRVINKNLTIHYKAQS